MGVNTGHNIGCLYYGTTDQDTRIPTFIMEPAKSHAETPARAGRYVRQPSGYKAFIPAPLPPKDNLIKLAK